MSDQAEITEIESGEQDLWSNKRLGDIFENIYSGGTPKKGVDEFYNGDIPFVKIEDLNAQKLGGVTTAEEHITEKAIEETSVRAFENGTLLFTIYGSLAETALVRSEVATNQAILGLWGAEKDNVLYVKYAIDKHQPRLESLSRQTTQANLGKGIVEKYQIPTPPLEEQRKIASVLYTVDQAIQKTEEIVARGRRLGEGLREYLFSTGIGDHDTELTGTLGQVPTDWNIARLREVADVSRGKFTHRPRNDPDFYGGNHPFIQTGEVVSATGELTEYHQTLNEKGRKVSKKFDAGTIIMTIAGNIGDTAIATFPVYFPDSLVGITPFENMNSKFLEHFFRYRQKFLNRLSTQTTQKNLNLSLLRSVEVVEPPLSEQKEIAEILTSVDQQIRTQEAYRDKLVQVKQGLMQDLLSGEVRTIDKDIEVVDDVLAHG